MIHSPTLTPTPTRKGHSALIINREILEVVSHLVVIKKELGETIGSV
jgi:hypothetical protein